MRVHSEIHHTKEAVEGILETIVVSDRNVPVAARLQAGRRGILAIGSRNTDPGLGKTKAKLLKYASQVTA